MGILIGIAVYVAWMVAINIFGGWALLLLAGGVALCVLIGVVQRALERLADRQTVERLLALEPQRSWRQWDLPAPESYALLRGAGRASSDAFKLGLLQLIAMDVLTPDGGEGDTTLKGGPAPADALAGSLVPIHRLWAASDEEQVGETEGQVVQDQIRESHLVTVKDLARRAHQGYGSLDGFADQVVVEELVKTRLYTREGGLTPAGEAALADLESRMAGVLREMQQRRAAWVEKEPGRALLAAVLAVALGQRRPPEEAELQLVGQQVEQGATTTVATYDASGQNGIWFDWHFFNSFDRYFQAMDSEVNAGDSGGDGSDGGDGGGGGGE